MNQDSIALLRDCSSGAKMALQSFHDVMDHVKDDSLRALLMRSMETHESIGEEAKALLQNENEVSKDPSLMARTMSWIKTNAELLTKNDDAAIADLITDGCGMGIKQLSVSFNKYPTASPEVKHLADRIRVEEDDLVQKLRIYL